MCKTKSLLRATASLLAGLALASAGANEPIKDNNLGLVARQCAQTFCVDKDSLELWLALEPTCSSGVSLSATRAGDGVIEAMVFPDDEAPFWSPTAVGSLCAIMGVVGM
ncbi:unnamed protein product, partial [Phaeothamnion confervicola]